MKIVVLAGGLSPERDVSLTSGSLISNALIENGHDVMLLDLFLGTDNKEFESIYKNKDDNYKFEYSVSSSEPDLEKIKNSVDNKDYIGTGVLDICKKADIVFMALHGSVGENGQLQAVFDLHNIKYTGTGYIGSLLAMDKDLSKQVMKQNNILTPNWRSIKISEDNDFSDIKYPCVVKPCSCGSSVGVSMVENLDELKTAVFNVSKYEDYLIIEEKINGREFSIGVINNNALPIIEIIPQSGFYDYKNKYQAGLTKEICPANIDNNIKDLLQNSAVKVHEALKLGFYSRIDFMLDSNNNAYCLEANTLPGMTPTSLLPQEAKELGISYNELCELIINEDNCF